MTLEQKTDSALTTVLLIIALVAIVAALTAPTSVKAILAAWFIAP